MQDEKEIQKLITIVVTDFVVLYTVFERATTNLNKLCDAVFGEYSHFPKSYISTTVFTTKKQIDSFVNEFIKVVEAHTRGKSDIKEQMKDIGYEN